MLFNNTRKKIARKKIIFLSVYKYLKKEKKTPPDNNQGQF